MNGERKEPKMGETISGESSGGGRGRQVWGGHQTNHPDLDLSPSFPSVTQGA